MAVKTMEIQKNFLNYTQDDFFWLKLETVKKIKEIMFWAGKNGLKTKVDMLDCSKSFSRIKADKTFDEVLSLILKKKPIFRIILRRDMNLFGRLSDKKEFADILEISVSGINLEGKEYFIFVFLEKEKLHKLLDMFEFKKTPASFYKASPESGSSVSQVYLKSVPEENIGPKRNKRRGCKVCSRIIAP